MRRVIDGQPTYRCPECLDVGLVTVFHPRAVRAIEAGDERRFSCGVRCNCSAGSQYPKAAFYDPARMVRCEYRPTDADVETLREWIGQKYTGEEFDPSQWSYPEVCEGEA